MSDLFPFNRPHIVGCEVEYIKNAVKRGKISGNGYYTQLCHSFFQEKYNFKKCLLTTSCTDALEMAAILIDIQPGDEVIVPSYTFVSTANAFVIRGAKIVFADSRKDHPGIDEDKIENLITNKTKAIVPVHYAGVACNMDKIMSIATKYNLFVIEDAAQAIDSFYTNKNGKKQALGSFGHFAAFSFHETKNIISGEGGLLVVNDERFVKRSEIIWEKGTNRSAFFKGEVDKYGWVDIGSSFLPSEIIAAFLWGQLECLVQIQLERFKVWNLYHNLLKKWSIQNCILTPNIHVYSSNNAHMYYLVMKNIQDRDYLINELKLQSINAVFHYQSLHKSPFFNNYYKGEELINSDRYSECLVRLPFYIGLDVETVTSALLKLRF